MNIYNIAIIGVGKMGGALALTFSKKNYKVTQLFTRNYEKAEEIAKLIEPRPKILGSEEFEKINADIVFITTQDSEIATVAENLAERLEILPYIFHTSGALSSKVLEKLNKNGCQVGSIHPLISISDAKIGTDSLKGAYFCLEGDTLAVDLATQIIANLEGIPFSIETKYKPLYHASAVTACGHLVALVSTAVEMLSNCGLSKTQAQTILFPLIKSTVENLSLQTPTEALTGTFARADTETLKLQLAALEKIDSRELLEIYKLLGLRSLHLAAEQGTDAEKLEQMRQILS